MKLRYRWFAWCALRVIRRGRTSVGAFFCGHTDAPDRWRFSNGLVYVNGGDWNHPISHHTYCLIGADGQLHGPFEWSANDPGTEAG